MNRTPRVWGLAALAVLPAAIFTSTDAAACGGCFSPAPPMNTAPEGTIVVAHRMAMAVSKDQTVLWDQIQYAGAPAEFAWVLPVRPGARVELASDAWFDTLDAATTRFVSPPTLDCSVLAPPPFESEPMPAGCSVAGASVGCGADTSSFAGTGGQSGSIIDVRFPTPPSPVSVVHHGSAGPYESVIVHSDVAGALPTWLEAHGYAIPDDIAPVLEAYAADGFDFAALRLLPAQGVQQMKPIRVVQPGASPTLPLRMVAAGAGPSTAMTLFVIGEGRWEVQNFPRNDVDLGKLTWDFTTQSSNYSTLRVETLAGSQGRSWIVPFAQPRALLSPVRNPVTDAFTPYQVGSLVLPTIGEAFVEQALLDGETSSRDCADTFAEIAASGDRVVDLCAGGPCSNLGPGEIDARDLACDPPIGSALPLADLALALTGMHPADVWLTRMEAILPRAALDADLTLQAAAQQVAVPASIVAGAATGNTCPVQSAALTAPSGRGAPQLGDPRLGFGVAFCLLGLLAAARRILRARPVRAFSEVQA